MGTVADPTSSDEEFFRVYGPWAPLSPTQVAEVMAGYAGSWWVVGGHAIEAFTGVARDHEDIDVSIFSSDFPELRRQLGGRFHLWSNHGGTFRVVTDEHPEPLDPLAQTWVREHAGAPWVMDVILNAVGDGVWRARRDLDLEAPLEDVTWSRDGVRYLNPELVLFFKARLQRPKDEHDLAGCLPLLSEGSGHGCAAPWRGRTATTRGSRGSSDATPHRHLPGRRWSPAQPDRCPRMRSARARSARSAAGVSSPAPAAGSRHSPVPRNRTETSRSVSSPWSTNTISRNARSPRQLPSSAQACCGSWVTTRISGATPAQVWSRQRAPTPVTFVDSGSTRRRLDCHSGRCRGSAR